MNSARQLGFDLAAAGAEQAAAHADREIFRWRDIAFEAFKAFCVSGAEFTTEDVRFSSPHVPEPPDRRAWGAVALRAYRDKLVIRGGYRPVLSSRGGAKTVWRAL